MLHGAWTWKGQNGYPTGYPLVYRTARGYWQKRIHDLCTNKHRLLLSAPPGGDFSARGLPVVGETQVSSQPLGGRHLVLVVTVKSADGQSGVAVVSGIQASASMQQWYLLVDPHTDQHMTSKSGQSSAVHLRIDYRHVRSDLRRSSGTTSCLHNC